MLFGKLLLISLYSLCNSSRDTVSVFWFGNLEQLSLPFNTPKSQQLCYYKAHKKSRVKESLLGQVPKEEMKQRYKLPHSFSTTNEMEICNSMNCFT